jgi:hypothetical protein
MSEPLLPPPPVPPPAPPVPPPGGPPVRIADWYNEAWRILQPVWVEVLLAGLLVQMVVVAATLACFLPAFVVAGPLIAGLHIYLGKRAVGLPAEVTDVFKGFRRFLDTFLLGAVIALPPLVVLVLVVVPMVVVSAGVSGPFGDFANAAAGISTCLSFVGIPLFLLIYPVLVGTLLVFAMPLVVFRGLGAVAAIQQSIELVKPQLGNFLLLLLANMVILMAASSVGGVLLCVGVLVLSPLATGFVYLVQLLAYRDFVGLSQADLAPYQT